MVLSIPGIGGPVGNPTGLAKMAKKLLESLDLDEDTKACLGEISKNMMPMPRS